MFFRDREQLVGIIAIGALFAAIPIELLEEGPVLCPIRRFTDNPCPTCGVTRSVASLAHGNFVQAWQFNPAGFFLVLAAASQVFAQVFRSTVWAKIFTHMAFELSVFIAFIGAAFLRYFGIL